MLILPEPSGSSFLKACCTRRSLASTKALNSAAVALMTQALPQPLPSLTTHDHRHTSKVHLAVAVAVILLEELSDILCRDRQPILAQGSLHGSMSRAWATAGHMQQLDQP